MTKLFTFMTEEIIEKGKRTLSLEDSVEILSSKGHSESVFFLFKEM